MSAYICLATPPYVIPLFLLQSSVLIAIMATLFVVQSLSSSMFCTYSHHNQYLSTLDDDCVADPFAAGSPAAGSPAAVSEGGTPAPTIHPQLVLRFTTKNWPKDPSSGFVFGSDPNSCDVLLHPSHSTGISRRQFAITFRPDNSAVILQNLSRRSTTVYHFGETATLVKTQRVIEDHREMYVHLPGLRLKIFKQWDTNAARQYLRYFTELSAVAPDLSRLKVYSSSTSSTVESSENNYYLDQRLGQGLSGTVYRAYHRLTGDVVAMKRFTPGRQNSRPWDEAMILQSISHVSNNWLCVVREI